MPREPDGRKRYPHDRPGSVAGIRTRVPNQRGIKTREHVLDEAVDVASTEGLESLSIRQLADTAGLSKSGVFELFGSKLDLQLATVDHAQERFVREVVERIDPNATPRIDALANAWFAYLDRRVFPGGCILTALSTEYDSRPGVVRDRVIEMARAWLGFIQAQVEADQAEGLLDPAADAAQIAFEVRGAFVVTNWAFHLFDDGTAVDRGREMLATITRAHEPGRRATTKRAVRTPGRRSPS